MAFYSAMFGVEPHKRRPGYANFAITEPPLKLVLIETSEAPGARDRRRAQPPRRRGRLDRRRRRGPRAAHRGRPGRVRRERHDLLLRPAGQGLGARPGRRAVGGLHRQGRRPGRTPGPPRRACEILRRRRLLHVRRVRAATEASGRRPARGAGLLLVTATPARPRRTPDRARRHADSRPSTGSCRSGSAWPWWPASLLGRLVPGLGAALSAGRGRRRLAADRPRAARDDVPGAGQGPLRPARHRDRRPAAARLEPWCSTGSSGRR